MKSERIDIEESVQQIASAQSKSIYRLCVDNSIEAIEDWAEEDEESQEYQQFLSTYNNEEQRRIVETCVHATWSVLVEYLASIEQNTAARFMDNVTMRFPWKNGVE